MLKQIIVALFVLCCNADRAESLGFDRDPEYTNFLAGLINTVKRGSGKFLTDHGYGSRLRAGRNIADAVTTYEDVFGSHGPGKRSQDLARADYDTQISISDVEEPETKRFIIDHGYGSRVSAGSNVADDKWARESLFGKYGPGKRSGFDRLTRGGGVYGDSGYFSRIDAAKKLAYDNELRFNIFGGMGPGKRR